MAKLAIVGTGFTGASLALALRPSKLFATISGFDTDRGRLQAAQRIGAIDETARSAAAAVEQAGVVVATVPSSDLEAVFRAIAPGLSPGAVVTETTLWKSAAQEAARALPAAVHFIGGRPVLDHAGPEPDGAAFRNAIWCLTPTAQTAEPAVDAMSAVVAAAGAQPYFLDPAEHDAYTAASELLPGSMLAALMRALTNDPSWPEIGKLAGHTLNRFALLAEELEPHFWHDAAQNREALSRWLAKAQLRAPDDAEWRITLEALARWRRDKRQLQASTMPPKSELQPNLLRFPFRPKASR